MLDGFFTVDDGGVGSVLFCVLTLALDLLDDDDDGCPPYRACVSACGLFQFAIHIATC